MSDIIVTEADRRAYLAFNHLPEIDAANVRAGHWDHTTGMQVIARHAAQARLEAEKVAHDVLGSLAWIQGQAEDAMGLAGDPKATEDDLRMLLSIASDIAINAEMASEKLAALSTRGERK